MIEQDAYNEGRRAGHTAGYQEGLMAGLDALTKQAALALSAPINVRLDQADSVGAVRDALVAKGWTPPDAPAEAKGWVAVDDALPPPETPVLIVYRKQVCVGELRWDHPGFEDTYASYQYWDDPENDGQSWDWPDITHWAALPELPCA